MASLQNLMIFQPAVDGDLIPEPPLDAIRKGAAADIPLLIGTTLDEWKLFTALDSRLPRMPEHAVVERFRDLLPIAFANAPTAHDAARQYREAVRSRGGRTTPFEIWSAFQSARIFHYPAIQLSEAQHRSGGQAHTYLFTWRPPAMRRTLGACHAIDIPFVFGLSHLPVARPFAGFTSPATRLSRRMQHAWIDFARTGRPGHGRLPDWDEYRIESRATMIFGRDCYVADAPLEPERLLWERWTRPAAAESASDGVRDHR
jgi:para-nitrobenzyl esterase